MYLPFTSPGEIADTLVAMAPPGEPPLWVLLIADRHGDAVPQLVVELSAKGVRACGGIFPGLIHGHEAPDSGMIALPLPAQSKLCSAQLGSDEIHWRQELPSTWDDSPSSAMILIDCLSPNIAGLLEQIYDHYGPSLAIAGSGSGYHDLRAAPTVFTDAGLVVHGCLFILVPQPATVQVRHGWQRVAGPFVASRTTGNVIQEFNWEAAGHFYRSQVEERAPDLAGLPIFPDLNSSFPLAIVREGGEDVIRDPIGLGENDALVLLSDVSENSVMYLVHGDDDALIAAARQAVEDCGQPSGVERCFVSDCYSRALKLGKDFTRELAAAEEVLHRFTSVVPEGVQALGEVVAHGKQRLEFFNKTFVVALTLP